MAPIAVYSSSDLKNTSDDAIGLYFTHLPAPFTFTADYTKSNVRLLLGYSSVAIAAVSFWADRKWDHKVTLPYITVAVILYFTLNLAFTTWVWWAEDGLVFEGTQESGDKIEIRTSVQKFSPKYTLDVRHVMKSGKVERQLLTMEFTKWFTSEGVFRKEPFHEMLKSEITALRPLMEATQKKTRGNSKK